MRFFNRLAVGLALGAAGYAGIAGAAAKADSVAGTWHFVGSASLTNNTNFDNVDKILTMAASGDFRHFVLNRFAVWLNKSLFDSSESNNATLLRPLLDDLLSAESVWALGGTSANSPDFIVALRLDDNRAQTWLTELPKLAGSPGQAYTAGKIDGKQWSLIGGESLWVLRAKGWLLVGRGNELAETEAEFLSQLDRTDAPAPALSKSWLEADLDWAQLGKWLPDAPHVFLPARTKLAFTASDHTLYVNAGITYPAPVPWKFENWSIPTNIIRDPLSSFTAGQDIAAYMSSNEPLSRLTENPLAGQYYVWSLGDLAFRTHAIWPVADATNSMKRVGVEATAAFNGPFKEMGVGKLHWQAERNVLTWENIGPFIVPDVEVAPETNGQYLVASLFPLILRGKPAPDELWQQILGTTNIVYYDWEDTGARLGAWQVLSAILPVMPRLALPPMTNAPGSTNRPTTRPLPAPVVVDENWLTSLRPLLTHHETITLITRVSPTELKLVRQSPLVLTSLELVLLSHWLSGTPSAGIPASMLPPPAKVTGSGVPPRRP